MKPMEYAAKDTGIMHHDLLIELGRVDMSLEDLEMQEGVDAASQDALRSKLASYRLRLRNALDKLPD